MQGTRDLQIRVGAGVRPPEHLEDGLLAKDHAGVALLAGEHQAVEPGVDGGVRLGGEAHRPDGLLAGHGLQQPPGQRRVVQRVVGHPRLARLGVARRADHRMHEPVRDRRPQAGQQLVPVGAAGLGDGDDQVVQAGIALHQHRVGDDGEAVDRGALAREPALAGEPARQRFLECHLGSTLSRRPSASLWSTPAHGCRSHSPGPPAAGGPLDADPAHRGWSSRGSGSWNQ